jgi:hemolysin D
MSAQRPKLKPEHTEFLSDAEAIEHRPLPRFARGTLYLLAAFLLVALVWASLSHIDRIVVARGKLATTSSTILIQPFVTSVVRSLLVREGQVVEKGQLLGSFDPTFATADLTQLQNRARELRIHRARLEAELNDSPQLAGVADSSEAQTHRQILAERLAYNHAQLERYHENLARLRASQKANRENQQILTKRLASAREIEDMEQSMQQQGNSSRLKLLQARDRRLALENDLLNATNQQEALARQLAISKAELDSYQRDRRRKISEELSTVKAQSSALEEQIAKAARLSKLSEMRAPVDAVVLKVAQRSVGSVVKEAEPLITLVPLDAPLQAVVHIAARDIGYVRANELTRLKLDAFPFQKHGALEGRLLVVSEDAFSSDAADPGTGGLFYEGRVSLGDKPLADIPADARLLPGMTLTAEIVVGRRTVISYFLYPVLRVLDESIREP